MQDTKFWRIVAVMTCVGILYVGHGLHNRGSDGLPSLTNIARAGTVTVNREWDELFTTSDDGRTVYSWKRFSDSKDGHTSLRHNSTATVPVPDGAPAQKP
jgi:hypothetical protein